MGIENMNNKIVHDEKNRVFRLTENGVNAELLYLMLGRNTVDFYRTFVPVEWRGQGLAEQLVRCGLNWANAEGHEILASCWYVQRVLDNDKRMQA